MFTNEPGSLQAADGSYYNPLDFRPDDVKVDLLAHQLALKSRWNGNIRDTRFTELVPVFYSVAQHSCIVHDLALRYKATFIPGAAWEFEPCPSGYGLFHDSGEGPLFDIPRPLKKTMPDLAAVETPIKNTILDVLAIPRTGITYECVRRIDNAMIFWERDALIGRPPSPYANEMDHPGGTLYDWVPDFKPWDPIRAKAEFMARYETLVERELANAQ